MHKLSAKKYQEGQILLISLLVLVIALTIGLSLATRSISTLHTTSAEENSQRAFSAAEAGIERALTATTNYTYSAPLDNRSAYRATVNVLAGNAVPLNNSGQVLKDDPIDVWLSNYPDYTIPWTGDLSVYWGNATDNCTQSESTNTMAALEIILISGSKFSPVIDHYAFDPCNGINNSSGINRKNVNHFSDVSPGGPIAGRNFAYKANVTVSNGLLARIIPLYAGAYISVSGATPLPPQGTVITSVGSSGNTQRKIITYRSFPQAPVEFYPYLIFSPQ